VRREVPGNSTQNALLPDEAAKLFPVLLAKANDAWVTCADRCAQTAGERTLMATRETGAPYGVSLTPYRIHEPLTSADNPALRTIPASHHVDFQSDYPGKGDDATDRPDARAGPTIWAIGVCAANP